MSLQNKQQHVCLKHLYYLKCTTPSSPSSSPCRSLTAAFTATPCGKNESCRDKWDHPPAVDCYILEMLPHCDPLSQVHSMCCWGLLKCKTLKEITLLAQECRRAFNSASKELEAAKTSSSSSSSSTTAATSAASSSSSSDDENGIRELEYKKKQKTPTLAMRHVVFFAFCRDPTSRLLHFLVGREPNKGDGFGICSGGVDLVLDGGCAVDAAIREAEEELKLSPTLFDMEYNFYKNPSNNLHVVHVTIEIKFKNKKQTLGQILQKINDVVREDVERVEQLKDEIKKEQEEKQQKDNKKKLSLLERAEARSEVDEVTTATVDPEEMKVTSLTEQLRQGKFPMEISLVVAAKYITRHDEHPDYLAGFESFAEEKKKEKKEKKQKRQKKIDFDWLES